MKKTYGNSENNRANGTTLDLCVIENIWSDAKHDWVQYYYSHAQRTPSYKAYLPKGNLSRLGVKINKMYRVSTQKVNGIYFWKSVVELKRTVAEIPETKVTLENFFE